MNEFLNEYFIKLDRLKDQDIMKNEKKFTYIKNSPTTMIYDFDLTR